MTPVDQLWKGEKKVFSWFQSKKNQTNKNMTHQIKGHLECCHCACDSGYFPIFSTWLLRIYFCKLQGSTAPCLLSKLQRCWTDKLRVSCCSSAWGSTRLQSYSQDDIKNCSGVYCRCCLLVSVTDKMSHKQQTSNEGRQARVSAPLDTSLR